MLTDNPILDVDSYKLSHFMQYPAGTTGLTAYFESRQDQPVKFFGLQYVLEQYLTRPVTQFDVNEAAELAEQHGLPFPREGWEKVVNTYDGKPPLAIRAVPEGTLVPGGNVLFKVECNDPDLFWLVTWFETQLCRVWYPTTVATLSWNIREYLYTKLQETSDNPNEEIPFKLHDFGSRGVSSQESAGIGGMAHLLNFLGTDTIEGILYAKEFYDAKGMPGFSIPATEHSTMTTWGRDDEADAMEHMLKQFGQEGALFACVSDSYDIYNAVENIWGEQLGQQVVDSGATLVVRPDSGDPLEMVLYCLKALDASFGHTVNSKGFKVLQNVRVIQGDGVDFADVRDIIDAVIEAGYSTENVAFGMGSGLLQRVNRDTFRFAYKVCEAIIDGKPVPVYKDPVDGSKTSKSGALELVKVNGRYETVDARAGALDYKRELQLVYLNGELRNRQTFEEIRDRS